MQHPYQELFEDLAACFTNQQNVAGKLMSEINSAGKLSEEEALNVYRQAVVARLSEALGETYQRVWRYCGDDEFFDYTCDFVVKNPSQVFDLGEYGQNFPEYLKALVPEEEAFLADLARLERLYAKLFHAPSPTQNSALFVQEQAANISNVELNVGRSANVLSAEYPVSETWLSLRNEKWDEAFRNKNPEHVLIYKNDGQIYFKTVTGDFVLFFQALKKNGTLNAAVSEIEELHPEMNATAVQEALQILVELNLLSA